MDVSYWLVAAPSFAILVALTLGMIRNNVCYTAVTSGMLAAAASLFIGEARGWDLITVCASMFILGIGWELAVQYITSRQGRRSG